jgi:hypothetical protein
MFTQLLSRLYSALARPARAPHVRRVILPDQEIRSDIGITPTREGLDFAVENYELDRSWDFVVNLSESAEFCFGTEVFKSLEGRFSTIPRIDRVVHEDREVFIVKTKLTKEELVEAIWTCVLRASEATAQSLLESDSSASHDGPTYR